MAVALRGPDAESWLTDVQMIDSASVRVHRKCCQLLSRRRLRFGGLTLFLGFGTAPVRRANPSWPSQPGRRPAFWSICFRYLLGRQLRGKPQRSSIAELSAGKRRFPPFSRTRNEPRGSTQRSFEAGRFDLSGRSPQLSDANSGSDVGTTPAPERVTVLHCGGGPGKTMLLSGRLESVECRRLWPRKRDGSEIEQNP